jgi:flagellar biosynthesis protein FlhA
VQKPDTSNLDAIEAALRDERAPELDWYSLPAVQPLQIAVGYKLVTLIDKAHGEPLSKRVKGVRQSLSEAMGCCCRRSACATILASSRPSIR